jgi:hypothetical protein
MNFFGNGQSMNNMNNMNNTTPSCMKNPDGTYSYPNGTQCSPSYLESIKSSSFNPMNWFSGSGGRRRTIKRGGGVRGYTDQNVASTASRFSGGQTAQPHQWTGGKRRRRIKSKRRSFKCNKCSKRKRHRH